jgi:hypothetical protein
MAGAGHRLCAGMGELGPSDADPRELEVQAVTQSPTFGAIPLRPPRGPLGGLGQTRACGETEC